MGQTVEDHPGIVTNVGTPDAAPNYSHTTIDYGPLWEMGGVRLIDSGTPDLTINVHLEQPLPVKTVEATITVGDSE